jgi:hypothetical protein
MKRDRTMNLQKWELKMLTEGSRTLHEQIHNFSSSPNSFSFRTIKGRRMRGEGCVLYMGNKERHTKFWLENPKTATEGL